MIAGNKAGGRRITLLQLLDLVAVLLLVLDELLELFVPLQVHREELHLLLESDFLVGGLFLQQLQVILRLVALIVELPGVLDALLDFRLFFLDLAIELAVDLVDVGFFLAELVDVHAERVVARDGLVQLLVGDEQLVLEEADVSEELFYGFRGDDRAAQEPVVELRVFVDSHLLSELILLLHVDLIMNLLKIGVEISARVELFLDELQEGSLLLGEDEDFDDALGQ